MVGRPGERDRVQFPKPERAAGREHGHGPALEELDASHHGGAGRIQHAEVRAHRRGVHRLAEGDLQVVDIARLGHVRPYHARRCGVVGDEHIGREEDVVGRRRRLLRERLQDLLGVRLQDVDLELALADRRNDRGCHDRIGNDDDGDGDGEARESPDGLEWELVLQCDVAETVALDDIVADTDALERVER